MNKILIVLALLTFVVFAGCTQTAVETTKVAEKTTPVTSVEPVVEEISSDLISENDNVEIGEMI